MILYVVLYMYMYCKHVLCCFRSLGVHVSKVRSLILDAWEPEQVKVRLIGEVCIHVGAKGPIRLAFITHFCSMKLSDYECSLYPLDGLLAISTHLYTWVKRGTVRVKCLAQEHNLMSLGKARTGILDWVLGNCHINLTEGWKWSGKEVLSVIVQCYPFKGEYIVIYTLTFINIFLLRK